MSLYDFLSDNKEKIIVACLVILIAYYWYYSDSTVAPYRKLVKNKRLTQNDNQAWLNSAGGFMNRRDSPPRNHDDVLEISNQLHDALAHKGWIWNPRGGVGDVEEDRKRADLLGGKITDKGKGSLVLDGAVTTGECGEVAFALITLLWAKTPYGGNMTDDELLESIFYPGKNGVGFISSHDDVYFGLGPNIYDPNNQKIIDYYLWGDHKVVKWNGKFYDPNYRAYYDEEDDMAVAQIFKGIEYEDEQFGDIYVDGVVATTDDAKSLKGFYLSCYVKNETKELATTENVDIWKDRMISIGPFQDGESPNASNNFGFQMDENYLRGITTIP